MTDHHLEVHRLPGHVDGRGASFGVPADLLGTLLSVQDVHVTTITPGSVRGNHFHRRKRELLTVLATDRWSVHWDTGEGTSTHRQEFGAGGFTVSPPLLWSHAIRNDGTADVFMFAMTDQPFTGETAVDSFVRVVTA